MGACGNKDMEQQSKPQTQPQQQQAQPQQQYAQPQAQPQRVQQQTPAPQSGHAYTSTLDRDNCSQPSRLNHATDLYQGGILHSVNDSYYANLGNDGNLYVFVSNHFVQSNVLWSSNSAGKGQGPFKLSMQDDGNLVIYGANNQVIWASNTDGKGQGPYRLEMQADGNLVTYGANNSVIWASNTNR